MTTTTTDAYDEVPYPSQACVESHPSHLAVLATLFGLTPPPVEACRVLELGCGNGANLIPMAAGLPAASFTGVDLAGRPIADGRAAAATLGLDNLRFSRLDVMDLPAESGEFDFIIAHGLYSWVPPDVQEQILAICARHLAPNGLAYISYNAYPTWHLFGVVRDILRYEVRRLTDPLARARAALARLEHLAGPPADPRSAVANMVALFARYLHQRMDEQLGDGRLGYLLHEFLAEVNEPVYFHQFVERANGHGLHFLAEADLPTSRLGLLPPAVAEALAASGGDAVELEQQVDFLRGRAFHRTVLSRQAPAPARQPRPDRLTSLFVTSAARPEAEATATEPAGRFVAEDGAGVTVDHPVSQAALKRLIAAWPRAIPFDDLLTAARSPRGRRPATPEDRAARARDAQQLGVDLVRGFCTSPALVGLHARPVQAASLSGKRPTASRVARFEALTGAEVTNLYHTPVALADLNRQVLGLLDGSRDRPALLADLRRLAAEQPPTAGAGNTPSTGDHPREPALGVRLDAALRWLAHAALLEE